MFGESGSPGENPDFLQLSLAVVSSNVSHGARHPAVPRACEIRLALSFASRNCSKSS